MSAKRTSSVDLARLFNTVTTELKNNQQSLNQSDEYNHNHGDNMVENFQTITRAMRETKGCTPTEQLEHASQVLAQRSSSSAQLYSQGLSQAADQMRGQSLITPENAMLLVNALMGGQQAQQTQAPQSQGGGMDLLGSLLGGMTGEQQAPVEPQGPGGGVDLLGSLLGGMGGEAPGQPVQQEQAAGGDMLSGLLGAFMGGEQPAQASHPQAAQGGGIDLNTLLTAGMAFFQARQQGAAPAQALVQAVMAGSQMTGTSYHTQSGQLVAQTLISTLGNMLSGRK